jgi:hypothetical protein
MERGQIGRKLLKSNMKDTWGDLYVLYFDYQCHILVVNSIVLQDIILGETR